MGWIVMLYRLPSDNSRARVAVWRELRRSGGLHLQQSVVAFPDSEAFTDGVDRLRGVIADVGGQLTSLRAEPAGGEDDARLLEAWNTARDAEYRELIGECGKFLAEIDHEFAIEKFTHAELDEEEAELDKLKRWHERIATRDVHGAANAPAATDAIRAVEDALARYSAAVFEHTEPS